MDDEIAAGVAPLPPPAMCAAVLVGPGRAELRRAARPEPARGQSAAVVGIGFLGLLAQLDASYGKAAATAADGGA